MKSNDDDAIDQFAMAFSDPPFVAKIYRAGVAHGRKTPKWRVYGEDKPKEGALCLVIRETGLNDLESLKIWQFLNGSFDARSDWESHDETNRTFPQKGDRFIELPEDER